MAPGRVTHALVSRIPNSFSKHFSELKEEIDLVEARKQHQTLCEALRSVGVDVIELPADENLPECVFVEDTAVVCNGTALICKSRLAHRQQEVNIVRSIIKKELKLPVVDIADEKAFVDGGDVLFTGREFFVGLSVNTNDAGARAVAAAFPEYPVTPVKVPGKNHLKSLLSVAGPDVLCISPSKESQSVVKQMAKEATYRYQVITVSDSEASNCIFVNGTLVHRAEYPESTKTFEDKVECNRISLKLSELSKAEGTLSSCCVLIKKTKHIRSL